MQAIRLISIAFLFASGVLAQTNVGQISGSVFDNSGGSVPGATVQLRSPATGQTWETRTNDTGFYIFPGLVRGTYDLRVEGRGFKAAERTGIILDAAMRRTADFTLELGAVSEAITVAAPAEEVRLAQGDVSQTITDRQINQIALNGRNYAQMLRLIPGASAASTNNFGIGLSTNATRINGIRSNSLYFMLDGGDNMANGGNSNATVNPNVDTIAEIRILSASYAAEFGGRSGAVVNVVTKSGTQEFHGTLFHFLRNDKLDARSFFAQSRPPLRFNNFGWTLGGPVYIPNRFNTAKNKLFFFAGQEWKYNRQSTAAVSVVPTREEKAGDFSRSSLPAPIDPTSRQPFPNRIIPRSRFSANGPKLLIPYPDPNFPGPGGNYSVNGANRTDTRQEMIRGDYYFSPDNSLMYRWTHDEWDIFNGFQGGNLGIVPGGRPRPGYSTILTWQKSLSPTLINSASMGLTVNRVVGKPQNQIMSRSALGLTYPELFPINELGVGPSVNIAGFTGYTAGDRIRTVNTTFQWRDDLTKIAGRHSLKFGVQIFRSRMNQNEIVLDNGSVTFNTGAVASSRNVIGDVLLGNFQSYTEGQRDPVWWARFTQAEFYAQDNWRVTNRLTLDFGMRYVVVVPVHSVLGNFTTFLPQRFDPARAPQVLPTNGTIVPGTGDPYNGIFILGSGWPKESLGRIPIAGDGSFDRLFSGLPRGSYPTRFNNWGPRFGFAFDPFGTGRTSIRGGFGVFYDIMRQDSLRATTSNPPFQVTSTVFDGNIDSPGGGATRPPSPPNLSATSTTMNQPSTYSFNLNVQHQLPGSMLLDVGYVGTMGRRLTRTMNLNQLRPGTRLNPPNSSINVNAMRPYQGYGSINFQENGDSSNYNSLQVSLNRRLSRGLTFGVNYTWSRTLDTTGGSPQDIYNVRADYGLSSIHRAHVFNFNYVWEIPFLRRHQNAFLRNVLGGWDLSGITFFQSGAPGSFTVPTDVARIGSSSSRASVIGDPNLPRSERTLFRWFNTQALLAPGQMVQGQFGNTGRNVHIGPGFSQWDVALLKNFVVSEQRVLQFRAESFNLPNHPSFTGVNRTVRFDAQGNPIQNFGAVTGAIPGRSYSFGLKFIF